MVKILQSGNPVLRKVSRPVETEEIKSAKIKKIIKLMRGVLEETPDGVALAAPQIGHNLRIFIVSQKAFGQKVTASEKLAYINPEIIKRSKKKKVFEEGCLSVSGVYGKIKRPEKVTVEALDEKGRRFFRGGSGLLAEIYQHEINHLDGVLFTDTATDLRAITRLGGETAKQAVSPPDFQ